MRKITLLLFINLLIAYTCFAGEWAVVDSFRFALYGFGGIPFQTYYLGIEGVDSIHCAAIGNLGGGPLGQPFCRLTTDGGKTWKNTLMDTLVEHKPLYEPAPANSFVYPDTNLCIIACDSSYYWISRDNCQTWKRIRLNTDTLTTIGPMYFLNSKTGVIFVNNIMYTTKNGMNSYIKHDITNQLDSNIIFRVSIVDSADIYLLCCPPSPPFLPRSVYKSTDLGVSWKNIFKKSAYLYSIKFTDKNNGWLVGDDQDKNLIFQTTDGGINWSINLDTTTFVVGGIRDIYFKENIAFALGWDVILFRSVDYGKHWNVDSTYFLNAPGTACSGLAFLNKDVVLLSSSQLGPIIKKDYSTPSAVFEPPAVNINEGFTIFPNILNRINDLKIRFSISVPSEIVLKIYDSQGNLIDQNDLGFVSDSKTIFSYHSSTNFSSGVYFLEATINNEKRFTNKFVLMK